MTSNNIVWSHSRLNTIMSNPAEYYLNYVQEIKPVERKAALSLGSAVHHGLELGTVDLTDYYQQFGNTEQQTSYSDEQLLAESMVGAYFRQKENIYNALLDDNGTQLDIVDEQHELQLTAHLDSKMYPDGHNFLGIIDLLFATEKGFILVDYKTSSRDVDWDDYKSQLFKYKLLLKNNFPEIPLLKVAIINLKKTGIRRKVNESDYNFRLRLQQAYVSDETLINFHIYEGEEFDDATLATFTSDLSGMIDVARNIVDNELFFINYSNINGMYGPSQYANIFYNTKNSCVLYKIKDTILTDDGQIIKGERDCDAIDMQTLKNKNICNKYDIFKEKVSKIAVRDKEAIFAELKKSCLCSDKLLEEYYNIFEKDN